MKRLRILDQIFHAQIRDKEDLLAVLHDATGKNIIDSNILPIIEAALQINELRAKDIMVPRNQVDVLDINDSIENLINKILATGHSRFPVIDGEISKVIGIFHSKDLIRYMANPQEFNLRSYLREAYFIPEIKHLDSLMYEMRVKQVHLAIIVDEFTNIVGIVSLEMIVEQLVGDIEDEYDSVEGEREILEVDVNTYRVKGHCTLIEINNILGLNWHDNQVETLSGFLSKILGRIPASGEILNFAGVSIEVINADSRKVKLLNIKKLDAPDMI
ncbi:MAG: magnesium/cobalt efflux protein [Burkholderiales bacterium]|jgi:magnesium and cobalt transporter|nr:magnesium/cobalt efflux protein [Burkholderiales bacterium]